MDISKILQMVVNIVLRKLISGGINKGMGMFARRGRSNTPTSPQDYAQKDDPVLAAKRARQLANQAKRLR